MHPADPIHLPLLGVKAVIISERRQLYNWQMVGPLSISILCICVMVVREPRYLSVSNNLSYT